MPGSNRPNSPNNHLLSASLIIASGFGSGYAKFMPGTVGTAACAILCSLVARLCPNLDLLDKLISLIIISAIGTIAISLLAKTDPSVNEDPGFIVIDEFSGLITTLLLVPWTNITLIIGFIAFRFFDILKPWPICLADKKKGAIWIMLDDIIAGAIAAPITWIIYQQLN